MSRAHRVVDDPRVAALYMSSTPAKWKPGTFEEFVKEADILHVVALCNRPPGGSEILADVWHLPVVDSHKTVDPRIPDEVVPKVVDWLRRGEPTLVSCLAGRSRSGIACGLVIRQLFDLNGEEALDELRDRRPRAIKREGPEAWLKSLPRPSEEVPDPSSFHLL